MTNLLSRILPVGIRRLLLTTGNTFSVKLTGAALGFLFSVLVARSLGATGAGSFFLALTIVQLTTVPGRLGQNFATLRLVAAASGDERWARVRTIFREGHVMVLVVSVVLSVGLYILAGEISSSVFDQPGLTRPLRMLAIGAPALTIVPVLAGSLRGIELPVKAELVERAILPAVGCLAFVALGSSIGPAGASLSYVAGGVCAVMVGVLFWSISVPLPWSMPGSSEVRKEALGIGLPLVIVASLSLVTNSADTIILGVFREADDVGIYQAAFKVAMLTGFVLGAVNSVMAPKFSKYHERGSIPALQKATRVATTIIVTGTLPIVLALLLAPDLALRLFGSEFTEGRTALRILCVGQAGRALAGATGHLLMMTGHETALRNNIAATAVLNVAGNFALIPLFGANGAAIATSGTEIVKNIVNVWLVKRTLGIDMWNWIRST